jgi:hypothetical protein
VDSSAGGAVADPGEGMEAPGSRVASSVASEEGEAEAKDGGAGEITDALAKVSCDIDDDEAMSVDEAEPQAPAPPAVGEVEGPSFDPEAVRLAEPHAFSPRDLLSILRSVETNIHVTEGKVRDEVEKRKKYRVDDCRRVHNYDEFLTTFLAMLTERNLLGDLVEHSLGRVSNSNGQDRDKEASGKPGKQAGEKDAPAGKQGRKMVPGGKLGHKTNLKHLAKAKLKKKRNLSESDGTDSTDSLVNPPPPIMYSDPSLPPGWKRKVKKRAGLAVGVQSKWDVLIVNPDGMKFKSKTELRHFIDQQSDSDLDVNSFDFSVCGVRRANIKFTARKKKLMAKKVICP